jgi:hypothetical protein
VGAAGIIASRCSLRSILRRRTDGHSSATLEILGVMRVVPLQDDQLYLQSEVKPRLSESSAVRVSPLLPAEVLRSVEGRLDGVPCPGLPRRRR